jgi:hypothetical protein
MSAEAMRAVSLQEAARNSTSAWQRDLAALFQAPACKRALPGRRMVIWELTSEDAGVEESISKGECLVLII